MSQDAGAQRIVAQDGDIFATFFLLLKLILKSNTDKLVHFTLVQFDSFQFGVEGALPKTKCHGI